jgi:predicted nucleic acid-binding protein
MADTNILLYILGGNACVRYFAQEPTLAVSCITEMEMLGRYGIADSERQIIERMLAQCVIIDMSSQIKQLAIKLRQSIKLKLPDAIIAATALQHRLTLVSADRDFCRIPNLDLVLINVA